MSAPTEGDPMLAQLPPIGGDVPGWRIGEKDGYWLDVITGVHQTRIVLQPKDAPPRSYHYFWCYFGPSRNLTAVAAARAWLELEDDEPIGFTRSWRTRMVTPGIVN